MFRVIEQRYPPGLRQTRHAHSDTTVTVILAGALRERVGDVEEVAHPLSIVVKPRATEHADEFGSAPTATLQITIPEAHAAGLEHSEPMLTHWRWQHGGPAVRSFLGLVATLRRYGAASVEVQNTAAEALAAMSPPGRQARGTPPRWLVSARQQVEEDAAPVRVTELAAAAGVHPVYLARQFNRWYGCSISELKARRRLQRAAAMMTTRALPLSDISYRAGYADQAHMCRVFKRDTGLTPTTFRRLIAG